MRPAWRNPSGELCILTKFCVQSYAPLQASVSGDTKIGYQIAGAAASCTPGCNNLRKGKWILFFSPLKVGRRRLAVRTRVRAIKLNSRRDMKGAPKYNRFTR